MQASNTTATTGRNGFQARAGISKPDAPVAAATGGQGQKKATTGEVVFRVKRKGNDGEMFNGKQVKWVTVGSLYKNTVTETGEVYYSFSAKEDIAQGIHKAYDATAPLA